MEPGDFEASTSLGERVQTAVEQAVAQRARQLTVVDPDFAAWPLNQPALLEALTRFVQLPDRRFVLVAGRFDVMQRDHPRFVAWRRNWAHAVQTLAPVDEATELPTLLLADRTFGLRVFDREHGLGRVFVESAGTNRLAEDIDAFVQRCEPSFPASTLGL